MHGKAIWKPRITEIAKASRDFALQGGWGGGGGGGGAGPYSAPLEPTTARTNVLMLVGLWSMNMKLNTS